MILEFLTKYQEELITLKIELNEELDFINTKIKESEKFVEVLDATNNSYFPSFTPRTTNIHNKNKIEEIMSSKRNLLTNKNDILMKIKENDAKLQELQNVISYTKNLDCHVLQNDFSDETSKKIKPEQYKKLLLHCEYLENFIFSDPMRCKIEIEQLKKEIQQLPQ